MLLFLCCCEQLYQLKRQGSISSANTHLIPASMQCTYKIPTVPNAVLFCPTFSCSPSLIHPTAALSPDSVPSSPSPPLLSWQDSRPAFLISPAHSFDSYPPTHHPQSRFPLSYISRYKSARYLTCSHVLNLFIQCKPVYKILHHYKTLYNLVLIQFPSHISWTLLQPTYPTLQLYKISQVLEFPISKHPIYPVL